MEYFKNVVLQYLSTKGLFLSPQFSIEAEGGSEWSRPDFVGLDFLNKQVNIVEVTTAYDVNGLIQKVNDRDRQWISKLREQLTKNKVIDGSWSFVVRVFLRQDRFDYFKEKLTNPQDVVLHRLEEVAFPWKWDIWQSRA